MFGTPKLGFQAGGVWILWEINKPLKWGRVYVVRSWSWNSDLSIQSKSAAFDSTKTTKFRFFNFHFFYPSLLMCFFSSFTFPWPFALKSGSAKKSWHFCVLLVGHLLSFLSMEKAPKFIICIMRDLFSLGPSYRIGRVYKWNWTMCVCIRPVHKNIFLEFPKMPGSVVLHFDR